MARMPDEAHDRLAEQFTEPEDDGGGAIIAFEGATTAPSGNGHPEPQDLDGPDPEHQKALSMGIIRLAQLNRERQSHEQLLGAVEECRIAVTRLKGDQGAYQSRRVSLEDVRGMDVVKRAKKWFVEGVIPSAGVFVVFGNSGSCKSWGLLDAALRSLCEGAPGDFMGIEGAAIRPTRRVLWIYGHEDLDSDSVDANTGKSVDLPVARTREILAREEDPLIIDQGSNIEFVFVRGRDELMNTLAHVMASDQPPEAIIIDTVTSVVPSTLDMKNSEAAEFYGDLKMAISGHECVLIPIGHPRKQGTENARSGARDPLHKDNLLGGAAITGVIAGSLGIHAEKPEDVLPDGSGIRVKLTKRNKTATSAFAETRVHWDADRHLFLQGDTPREKKQAQAYNECLSYLKAVKAAAVRANLPLFEDIAHSLIRGADGIPDEDDNIVWTKNISRTRARCTEAGFEGRKGLGWIEEIRSERGRIQAVRITQKGYDLFIPRQF